MRRKAAREDVAWLLQKGVIQVVKSAQFSLGVRRMKVTCMTTGVHGRKKVIHEHVNTRSFRSMEQAPLWSICR